MNTAAMRWPMQATKAPAHRQRVNRPLAILQVIATTFVMNAMVGRQSRQLKMPRPDAYDELAKKHVKDALRQLTRDDGGPLMWPRITESEQDSLDTTCRKLNRFLRESANADPSD